MTDAALTALSASALVRLYRARALSQVVVTRAVLDRIESKTERRSWAFRERAAALLA